MPEGLWELGEKRGSGAGRGGSARDMRGARGGTSSGVTNASGFVRWGERAAGRVWGRVEGGEGRGRRGEDMRKRFQVSQKLLLLLSQGKHCFCSLSRNVAG